ncbi:MAG: hypothetical protein ACKVZH_23180 [Blastocatellia bacterium]
MRFRVPHLMQESDRFRFSMRGNHIYILLSSFIHLSLGIYFKRSPLKWLSRLQTTGSALMIQASAMIVVAFFFEPKLGLDRPVTLIAMVMALIGMMLHAICALKNNSDE